MDVEGDLARGDLTQISEWLRRNIWQYGALKKPKPLMEQAFGGAFDAKYYVEYLKRKYEELY